MPAVLHLVKGGGGGGDLAAETIRRQIEAGDRVTVVLLDAAPAPVTAAAVTVRRVPEDLSWSGLLDLVFGADQVVAW